MPPFWLSMPMNNPRAVAIKPDDEDYTREQSIVEAWAQGFNVGAIILLILLLLCNYRKRVLLHKLILLEVCCCRFPKEPIGLSGR